MNIMLTDFWNVVNSSGGAEKVLCRMANELVDRGHKVTVTLKVVTLFFIYRIK